jgi:hypothetical protein
MPAPKAVLRDILERGLDPSKPHSRIASDGKLAGSIEHVESIKLAESNEKKSSVEVKPEEKLEKNVEQYSTKEKVSEETSKNAKVTVEKPVKKERSTTKSTEVSKVGSMVEEKKEENSVS